MIIYKVKRVDWMDEFEDSDLYMTKDLAYKAAASTIIYELLPDFLDEFIRKPARIGFIGQLFAAAKKLDFESVYEQWEYLQKKYNKEGVDKLTIEPVLIETEENKYNFNNGEDLEYIENWLKE